jgi:hypothetical protein
MVAGQQFNPNDMAIYLIHGLGEAPDIFDKIAPSLPGQQIFINVWDELGTTPEPTLNVQIFAQRLVEKYQIGPQDVAIGHSMGGWISHHIKGISGCKVVQLGSWTDKKKVLAPIHNTKILYFLVRTGLLFNAFTSWLSSLLYLGRASRPIFVASAKRLSNEPVSAVLKQMQLIFEPVPPLASQPELRIHALGDEVIGTPDEPYVQVPGDHFSVYTYPAEVLPPILALLAKA